jgi:hypothetical protein
MKGLKPPGGKELRGRSSWRRCRITLSAAPPEKAVRSDARIVRIGKCPLRAALCPGTMDAARAACDR